MERLADANSFNSSSMSQPQARQDVLAVSVMSGLRSLAKLFPAPLTPQPRQSSTGFKWSRVLTLPLFDELAVLRIEASVPHDDLAAPFKHPDRHRADRPLVLDVKVLPDGFLE